MKRMQILKTTDFPPSPAPVDIAAARARYQLTQRDAAALCYRSRRVWQMYEAGEVRMDPFAWECWLERAERLPANLKLRSAT